MQPSRCSPLHRMWPAGCLLLLLLKMQSASATNCTTPATFQSGASGCPTAAAAVTLLLGSNSQMTATNQTFTGNCTTKLSGVSQLGLITSFGTCHYLKDSMPAGAVVLSSGRAVNGSYANNTGIASGGFIHLIILLIIAATVAKSGGISSANMSDPDLNAAKAIIQPAEKLFDIAKLEFDVTPQTSGNMAWQYVFGSEEYGSLTNGTGVKYADIFVMTIKGPGNSVPVNVALVPGATTPISVLSINKWANTAYYLDNKRNTTNKPVFGVYNEEYEGFTTLMTTRPYAVTANQTYHIKLAIADGADSVYDSIVWVKAASLNFYTNSTNPTAINTACVGSWSSWSACNVTACGLTGQQSRTYTIATPASGNGAACEAANNATGTQPCSTAACPVQNTSDVDCLGSWSLWLTCDAVGCVTTGNETDIYNITTPASGNGQPCEAADGDQRQRTCSNSSCPVDCAGSWSDWECDAPCNDTGTATKTWIVTTPASGGGQACPADQSQPCTGDPCPAADIDCQGTWLPLSACNVTACGMTRQQPVLYNITVNASGTGAPCEAADGDVKTQDCSTAACPDVDCVGSWSQWSACDAVGCNTTGNQTATYAIATPASGNGQHCEAVDAEQRRHTCSNPCPVDCVGGHACPEVDGAVETRLFHGEPCPVVDVECVGSFVYGDCSAICGGGVQTSVFLVTTAAANGGAECNNANQSTTSRPCNAQQCVYSSQLASVTIQVPTTQATCDPTTRDFLVQYWTGKLAANSLVVPETVSVVVGCDEANAHRRFLLAAQQALYAVKTTFKLKSTQSENPVQSSGTLKQEVSIVVAAVQQLITNGDLSTQLSSNTNTTLAEGASVNVVNLPEVPCSSYRGYHGVWNSDHSVYTCEPNSSDQHWVVPVAVVVSVTGFMLLAAVAFVVRRRICQRRKGLLGNNRYGVTGGELATIVVTGVDGYSGLMHSSAAVTHQAMAVYDAILHKAVAAHAGHVVKHEGDSWSVAFNTPADAVAFCLQIQQALQKSRWPAEIGKPTMLEAGVKPHASAGLAVGEAGDVTAEIHVNQPPATHPTVTTNTGEKAGNNAPTINVGTQALPPDSNLLGGLKVRMGVASGWVPANIDIAGTAPWELAKAIADVANGGQILLDPSTAGVVCKCLTDHDGKLPLKTLKAELEKLFSSLSSKFVSASHAMDIVLLDKGQYYVASLAGTLPAAAEPAYKSEVNTGTVADDTNTAGCSAAPDMQPSGSSIANATAAGGQLLASGLVSNTGEPRAAPEVDVLLQSIFLGSTAPRMPGSLGGKEGTDKDGTDFPSSSGSVAGGCARRLVHVSPYHTSIKGYGEMDLVCLTNDELLPTIPVQPAVDNPGVADPGAHACSGPLVILHKRPITIPNTLNEFKQDWSSPASSSQEKAAR